jgi:hypothetical protein
VAHFKGKLDKQPKVISPSAANKLPTQGEEIVQGTFKTTYCVRVDYTPGQEQIYSDELYSCSLVDAPEYNTHTRTWAVPDTISTNPRN